VLDRGRTNLDTVAVHAGALWSLCMPGRGEGSSRTMLATARPSCLVLDRFQFSVMFSSVVT